MKYVSEITGKIYSTVEELEKAETEVKLAEEKKKKELELQEKKKAELKMKREERAKEVEEAFKVAHEYSKKANDLLSEFCKDYGAFHYSYTDKDGHPVNLFDSLFDWFF